MAKEHQTGVILLCIMLFNTCLTVAQSRKWESATSKDGKIATKYSISTRSDENGNDVALIESVTTATEKINMDRCIELMKDVSKHKFFHSDDSSTVVKTISENEWIIYYYTEGTFFTPDADGVYTLTFTEDKSNKTADFTIQAVPTLLERTEAKRFTYLNKGYSFEDMKDGTVRITMTTRLSPAFRVPGWIMNMAFPHTFFDVMQKFINLAHNE
ncbi:hypothetical protein [Fulvivirga imtechensis]|nr:hypothetical protein [Fulvivirga imtechensis]